MHLSLGRIQTWFTSIYFRMVHRGKLKSEGGTCNYWKSCLIVISKIKKYCHVLIKMCVESPLFHSQNIAIIRLPLSPIDHRKRNFQWPGIDMFTVPTVYTGLPSTDGSVSDCISRGWYM